MKFKKIVALGFGVILLGATLGLAGCQTTPIINGKEVKTTEDIQALMDTAKTAGYSEGEASVDITSDNAGAVETVEADKAVLAEQAARDAIVIADYKAEVESLQATQVTESTSGVVGEYEQDDIGLNAAIASFTLDDSDLAFLQDQDIEFDGNDYDIHENIIFSGDLKVRTSVYDEDFDENVYLTLESANAIEYRYVFDDVLNVSDVTDDDTLEISLLGQDIEIVDIDATSFTIIEGESDIMEQGQTKVFTIDEKEVTVEVSYIGSDSVKFVINGDATDTLEDGEIGSADDYEVWVDEILDEEAGEVDADKVEFRIAEDVETTFDAGDEVVLDDERWEYDISVTTDTLNYISVIYVEDSDSFNDEYQPITLEESYALPSDFATVSFGLTDVDYFTYNFEFTEHNNVPVMRIDSSDEEGIVIGTEEVDKVYFNGTSVEYEDSNGDDQTVDLSDVHLLNDETDVVMSYDGQNFTIDTDIVLITDGTLSFLGAGDDTDAVSADIKYLTVGYGTQDEALVTSKGFIIESPEDNGDSDEFILQIPSETVEGTIKVN